MLCFDEAIALLAGQVVPLPAEDCPLAQAAGRVLAAPVIARQPAPRHPVAAMDGYAVHDAATRPGEPLRVIGHSRAGAGFEGTLGAGEAVRIFTGAPMPAGADRCIPQEHARQEGDLVRFDAGYGPAWHVRAAASDFAAGATLLAAGTPLSPGALVAAAAADLACVRVARRPRVAILATGDELAPPGSAGERPYAIPESVSAAVAAMASKVGGTVVSRACGPDDLAQLERMAGDALTAGDVVVVTGGASVGEHDFAKAMFARHGLELLFARLAIKPGKPVWLGRAGGRWVIGLPGNPGSALVTARLFLIPLLSALQGRGLAETLRWRTLPLAGSIAATDNRETFARAGWGQDGLWPVANQESGAQAVLAGADWLIRRPAGAPAAEPGDSVAALEL